MLQLILCLAGRHRHYRRRIKRDPDGRVRSECRGCNIPMVRDDASGAWRVARSTEAAATHTEA